MAGRMVVMAFEHAEVVYVAEGTPVDDIVKQLQELGYFHLWYPDIYENGVPVNRHTPIKSICKYFFSKLNSMNV